MDAEPLAIGPLNRFVIMYGENMSDMLHHAVSNALTTAHPAQENPDLDARVYVEGSVQIGNGGEAVCIRVFLCDMRGFVLRPWREVCARPDFERVSRMITDAIAGEIDRHVGAMEDV